MRHVGNFYAPRTPQALIEALARLHEEQPDVLAGVRVELIGQIRPALDHRALGAALPGNLLTVHAPVDYLESLRLMQDADLLLVVDAPSEHSVFLPSKLIDYLGAGKPIVALSPPGASAGPGRQPGRRRGAARRAGESRRSLPLPWRSAKTAPRRGRSRIARALLRRPRSSPSSTP